MFLRHYIDFLDGNGFVEVHPPKEWKDLEIELSFMSGEERLSSGVMSWTSSETVSGAVSVADSINDYIAAGLTGGTGIFEGLPYQVRFECDGSVYTVVNACIDLASAEAQYSCDEVNAPIRETGNVDFLSQRAESFRFEYLYSLAAGQPGRISDSDFIDIWYQAGRYPQKVETMVAALSLYVTLKETYETIKRIADVISQALALPSGALVTAAQIIYLTIYLIALVVALINMIQTLIDLIFPFVYYHRAMYTRTLFERGCAYLGLNFSSSIFASTSPVYNDYVMPAKPALAASGYDGVKVGQPSTEKGFYEGTFGQFLRDQIERFNAKIRIANGTLYFEVEQTYIEQSTYKIPEVEKDFYSYNAGEVPANYVISYQYDNSDLYSYDKPDGVNFQVTVQPTTVINKQNVLLRNLEERIIPYSLPNVKTSQSRLEQVMAQVFNGFAGLVNAIAGLFSSSSSPLIPTIPSSVNILQLDTHFTAIPKCGIYLGGGKTDPNSSDIIGADALFTSYHFWNCPKPIGACTHGNQWIHKKEYRVPMCCEDYLLLKDKNYATYKNFDAVILSLKWNPYNQVAVMDFKYNSKYTDNLTATTYMSGTQIQGVV